MTTTADYNLTYAQGWQEVANGSASVTVQLKSDGPIVLQVAADVPDAGSFAGFVLDVDGDSSYAGNALAGTDKVYCRVMKVGERENIAVMAT